MVRWVPQTPGLSMRRGRFRNPPGRVFQRDSGSQGHDHHYHLPNSSTPRWGQWREVEATLTSRAGTRGCRFGLSEPLLVAASCQAE